MTTSAAIGHVSLSGRLSFYVERDLDSTIRIYLGPFTQNAKVPFASCACRASFSHTDTSKPPSLKILNELVSCTHPVLTSARPHVKTASGLCLANTRALFCSLHLHHFIMMIGIIPDIVTTLRMVMMYN